MRRVLATAIGGLLMLSACNGGGGASVEAFCRQIEALQAQADEFDDESEVEDFTDVSAILDDLRSAMRGMRTAAEDLRRAAPNEIRDDVTVVVAGVIEITEIFIDADNLGELITAGPRMDAIGREIEEPAQRVRTYAEAECDIELEDDFFAPIPDDDADVDLEDFDFEDFDFEDFELPEGFEEFDPGEFEDMFQE